MKFFDAGQHAVGVIAVGQVATGVFAFGQIATGVVAIGQVARGGICVGQGAIGLVTWGMGSVGLLRSAGMIGVGGKAGLGIILPLLPNLARRRTVPETTSFEEVRANGEGWIACTAAPEGNAFSLAIEGQRLPVKASRAVVPAVRGLLEGKPREVFALLQQTKGVLVVKEVQYVPDPPSKQRGYALRAALGVAAMIGLGIGFWPATGNAIVEAISPPLASTSQQPATTPKPRPGQRVRR